MEELMFVSDDPEVTWASKVYQRMNRRIFRELDLEVEFTIVRP